MIAELPSNEAERLAALRDHRILDTPPGDHFDALVCLAAYTCDVPMAAVSLVDEHRQWFKARTGIDVSETSREDAFCAHAILGSDLLVVADAQMDRRFADSRLVTKQPFIRFYAGCPLITAEGYSLGALCVMDVKPRRLGPQQQDILRLLGRQAASYLATHRRMAAVTALNEESRGATAHGCAVEGLGSVTDAAFDGMCVTHLGIVIDANAAFAAQMGFDDPRDLLGRASLSFVSPKSLALVHRKISDCDQDIYEVNLKRRDGSEFKAELRHRYITLGGQPARVTAIRNATHRKVRERAHSQRETAMQVVLDNVPVMLHAVDESGVVTVSEGKLLSAIRRKPGEIVGQSVFQIGRNEDILANSRRALAGENVTFTTVLDGLALQTELRPVVDADGSKAGFVSVTFDVTDRAASEERIRTLFERSSEAHLIFDGMGIFDCNDATLKLFRCADKSQMIAFHPAVWSPEYQPDGRLSAEKCVEMDSVALERGFHRFEWVHRTLDGKDVPVEVTLTPVTLKGRTMMLTVLYDLTERKRTENQLKEYAALLEEQKRELKIMNRELAAQATTDWLTGLLNHRGFQDRLEEAAVRATPTEGVAVVLLDLDGFRFFNDTYGPSVGDAVIFRIAAVLREQFGSNAARLGGDDFALILTGVGADETVANLEARVRHTLHNLSFKPEGDAFPIPISLSVGASLLQIAPSGGRAVDGTASECREAMRVAGERLRHAKTVGDPDSEAEQLRSFASRSISGFSMLDSLVTAVDNKDRYTRNHCDDVMQYSVAIARTLGLSEREQHSMAVSALLHDLGKIGVPDSILRKPGPLTAPEFEAVKQHPQMGAIIVQSVPGLEHTLDAIRHHHERWDGTGYPFGLREKDIPLSARIMAVADAFSAMTTDRPYRQGMDRQMALDVLRDGAGKQWDPACVQAFLRALREQAVLDCAA